MIKRKEDPTEIGKKGSRESCRYQLLPENGDDRWMGESRQRVSKRER